MRTDVNAAALDAALLARQGALETMTRRWSALAYLSAIGFLALLYSNPQYWWPTLERLRLAFATMAIGALATLAHRLTSGERLRLGGRGATFLFAYLAFVPLSLLWTLDHPATMRATVDVAKLIVVYATILNALDARSRLRTFLLVGALASLGPSLGGIWTWWQGEGLVEGFRTRWRGLYADPNRLAMSLTAVLPFALYGVYAARRAWTKLLFAGVVAAQVSAIVLTHSRSGAVAAAVATLAFLLRGRRGAVKGVVLAGAIGAGIVAFAPSTFWQRQATIADFAEDASVAGREAAWTVLGVIVEERPLGGVGAGAFLSSWSRYAPLEAGGRRFVAHNIFMEIVGDLGVVAFLLFSAYVFWLLRRTWRAGDDPLVGLEARAIAAGLVGYLVCELANGYSLSWFLYFLFGAAAAAIRLSDLRAAMAEGRTA
ncbi:MAG TPA: O-antigen ligase family protein [Anaeromyxobacteraceae bacterium]|nr:O-antigen ligase family protein [Anaeromyxobacteraceae bacterium]